MVITTVGLWQLIHLDTSCSVTHCWSNKPKSTQQAKKENNISIHKWSTTHSAEISQKQDLRNIYAIMKTMCPPGYHHNGFVSIHALEDMMYAYTLFLWLYICCTHLSFVRLEQFVCRGSLISTYLRKFN